MKRLFDILVSAVGLILLLPLFAVVAVLVKRDSAGPVFFVQRRVGRHLKPFNLFKFRTMVSDAVEKGIPPTAGNDLRITRVGRVLRKTKFDELPQLYNVLRGDMSIVGPRPEVEKDVNLYRSDYEEILRVRPGITDIASLTYRDEEQILEGKENPEDYYVQVLLPEKIRLAREYGRRASIFYDVKLIVLTMFSVLYPKENILVLIDRITPYRKPIVVGIQILIFSLSNYLAFFVRFDGAIPHYQYRLFLMFLPVLLLLRIFFLFVFSLDTGLWRYASVRDLWNITASTSSGSVIFLVAVRHILGITAYPRSIFILDWFMNIFLLGSVRMLRRLHEKEIGNGFYNRKVIIIGAGDAAEMLLRDIDHSSSYSYKVVGFIDDNPAKKGLRIRNVPILGTRKDVAEVVERERPDEFIIAIPTASREEFEGIVKDLRQYALPIKTVPSFWSILSGRESLTSIKIIEPEDILFRAPACEGVGDLQSLIEGRTVMVTGAGGSIGSELCRQIAGFRPGNLILFERHEENLYKIDLELRSHPYDPSTITSVIGDVLDERRLDEVMEKFRPEIVLHAAAYKHVPLMEGNPYEAFKTNVLGTRMVAEKARQFGVKRFLLISTDKAVNPVNVMGMTKKIAEDIVRYYSEDGKPGGGFGAGSSESEEVTTLQPFTSPGSTKFIAVRFGNVLDSSGSVVPLFREQIKKGGPVTVTHADMTRYFMTIPEAVHLVLQAATISNGGEVFVLDMGTPVRILDLAQRMIGLYGYRAGIDIDISFVGLRPGEKLYEELFNLDEMIEKTPHPKINKAILRRKVNESVVNLVRDPAACLQENDIRSLLARLAEQPPEKVVKS
jgi:FlaA1/EpsC-like NDP-sugar epimerase/lipopolysaccharide/colanic/teichoic acid biosynthesis glycosyltransferase